jgi:cytidine deaminase
VPFPFVLVAKYFKLLLSSFIKIMNKKDTEMLATAAVDARQFAQAKYSGFPVGAALLTDKGKIYKGCNVESSSFGLTICAERVALTKALSEGEQKFTAIAIAAKDGLFCPPCGACRQLLYDYAPQLKIILTNGSNVQIMKLTDLLPNAFDDSQIGSI